MVIIYVLKLKNGKFYVGKTHSLSNRLKSHFDGNGCVWTRKHPPIELIFKKDDCDNFDEDKYTLKYMSLYGIENVRGGSFCQENLDADSKLIINKMLFGASNRCYFCGDPKHFITECELYKNKSLVEPTPTPTPTSTFVVDYLASAIKFVWSKISYRQNDEIELSELNSTQ